MSNWGVSGRIVRLYAASLVIGLLCGVATARAAMLNPFYQQIAAPTAFDWRSYDQAMPAPFTMPEPGAAEPFGAQLGPADNKFLNAKWDGVKKGLLRDRIVLQQCRDDASACSVAAEKFLAIVERAQRRNGWSQIAEINRSVNLSIRAVSDVEQYGVRDRWVTPVAMFTSSAGDCEDLAIAKYVLLRELGHAEDDLRLVIVNDGSADEAHAVAAVRHEGRWLLLDNKTLEIREADTIAAFEPLFVIGRGGVRRITGLAVASEKAPWTAHAASPAPVSAAWPTSASSL